jgi:hypothetical protein
MPKGVPWTGKQEKQLITMCEEGKTVVQIATAMGKSEHARMKNLQRLGLKVGEGKTKKQSSPPSFPSLLLFLDVLCASKRCFYKKNLPQKRYPPYFLLSLRFNEFFAKLKRSGVVVR